MAVQLPVLKGLDHNKAEDVKIVKTMTKLTVYQDSDDENQYYYVPPFRVFNYNEGSATYVPFTALWKDLEILIKNLDEITLPTKDIPKHLLDMKNDRIKTILDGSQFKIEGSEVVKSFYEKNLESAQINLEKAQKRVDDCEARLEQALEKNIPKLIDHLEKKLITYKAEVEKIQIEIAHEKENIQTKNMEIDTIKKDLENKIILEKKLLDEQIAKQMIIERQQDLRLKLVNMKGILYGLGVEIELSQYPNNPESNEKLIDEIRKGVKKARNSYGGFFNMNIYAGFTKEEVDTIYSYLSRMPQIKLSIMPARNFEFVPTTDVLYKNGNEDQTTIFRKSEGIGNYTGSTLTFDLTLIGAKSVDLALKTFIIPVGIKSKIEMKQTSIKGSLTCDFNDIKTSKVSSDVKNGGIVFSDDVSKDISFDQNTKSLCHFDLKSGSKQAAEYEALKALEDVYHQFNMKKVLMSGQDAKKYHDSTLRSLENVNKKQSGNSWYNSYSSPFWKSTFDEVFSGGSSFYWHSTKENLEDLSKVKINKSYDINSDEEEIIDWPTKICLTYDAHKGAYRRCVEEEEQEIKGIAQAKEEALSSKECQDLKEDEDCGKKRKEEMLKQPEVNPNFKKDNLLI